MFIALVIPAFPMGRRARIWRALAMRRIGSKAAFEFLSMGLAIAAPGVADAQAAHGDFGLRSQASIRLSVSVAPRFESPSASSQRDPSGGQSTRFASNAPSLHYSVKVYPAQPALHGADDGKPTDARSETRQAVRTGVLFLIIPE
jgi:hypothetical protein